MASGYNLGTRIERNKNGEVVKVHRYYTKITDAGLEDLKRLTNLRELVLLNTQVTNAGVAELQYRKVTVISSSPPPDAEPSDLPVRLGA